MTAAKGMFAVICGKQKVGRIETVMDAFPGWDAIVRSDPVSETFTVTCASCGSSTTVSEDDFRCLGNGLSIEHSCQGQLA